MVKPPARGFSLIEVVVALAILLIAVLGLAQTFLLAGRATAQGRRLTTVAVLAQQKLDQLRSLAWRFDTAGVRISDVQTDTAAMPELPAGGTGLQPSPPGTLAANIDGYCDFLDAGGRILAGGSSPPPGTVFVRRWAIVALPANPLDTLVLHVRLLSPDAARSGAADAAGLLLTTVRTRVVS